MRTTTIFWLLALFFIINFTEPVHACNQYKFPVRGPGGIPCHPLELAIQQANKKEVQKIMNQINSETRTNLYTYGIDSDDDSDDDNDRIYHLNKSFGITLKEACNHKLHPTTRQKYYEIYDILKNNNLRISHSIKPMPSLEEMMQEYRQAHLVTIATIQATAQNNKIRKLATKQYLYNFHKS